MGNAAGLMALPGEGRELRHSTSGIAAVAEVSENF